MKDSISTTTAILEDSVWDGGLPLSAYRLPPKKRGEPRPTPHTRAERHADKRRRQLRVVNILFRQIARNDSDRLLLVSAVVGRPIASTHELTVAEVLSILEHSQDRFAFTSYLYQELESLYEPIW